jgi:prepilin-type N-terminal cleavage/methylation domain-containing protein
MSRRSRARRPCPDGGFSLVELLVAASLSSLVFLALAGMFPLGLQSIEYGGRSSQALALAQQKIEELKNGPFPPPAGSDTVDGYARTWTVTSAGVGTGIDDLRKIAVTVTWPQVTRPGNLRAEALATKP